jgi:hypothetical protein
MPVGQVSELNGFASILYCSSRSIVGWIGQKLTSAGLAASICSPGAHAIVQKTSPTESTRGRARDNGDDASGRARAARVRGRGVENINFLNNMYPTTNVQKHKLQFYFICCNIYRLFRPSHISISRIYLRKAFASAI